MNKYDAQIKAWALDRAIETLKISATSTPTADEVIFLADKYCEYTAFVEEVTPEVQPDEIVANA